jgi:hypothetical protein
MKRLYTTLVALFAIAQFSYAQQWTTSGSNIYNSNTGNVGIGIANPNVPFHIYAGSTNTITTGLRIQGGEGSTSSGSSLLFSSSYSAVDYQTGKIAAITSGWGTSYNSDLAFYSNTGVSGSNLTEKMRITSAGNVGIGTATPLSTLHVFGNFITGGSPANLDGVDLGFLSNSAQLLVGWNRLRGRGEIDFISNQGGGDEGGYAFYNHDNSNVETQLMRIQGNGNVAIGTTDPHGYKLAVNGDAIATSMTVKLYASWPDYVFKPTYKLPSLTEVKTYIDQNQHLPDMPSAQEVERNGLNLGDMVKLQAKKIEELTLYLIDQQQRVKAQNERIERLEKLLSKQTESK